MDDNGGNGAHGKEAAMQRWKNNTEDTIARTIKLPTLRSRAHTSAATIRSVTPEAADEESLPTRSITPTRTTNSFELSASPRSLAGGEKSRDKRQGLVFDDAFEASSDSSCPQGFLDPPSEDNSPIHTPNAWPRTRTLDEANRFRSLLSKSRPRIGSVHNSPEPSFDDESASSIVPPLAFPVKSTPQGLRVQKTASMRDRSFRTTPGRDTARSASPLISPTLSTDSLPVPLATSDADKILRLMKTLQGGMRGAVEYQVVPETSWHTGVCYIDQHRGGLMCEGDDRASFHSVILADLRGCRVRPSTSSEKQERCLDVLSSAGIRVMLIVEPDSEFDHWLAAMLYWQQIRFVHTPVHVSFHKEHEIDSPASTGTGSVKRASIIKAAKLLLWEKGPIGASKISEAGSNELVSRPSAGSWHNVGCTLQDNGVFRLTSENDVVTLSVVHLSQLCRSAIQRLDRSVLDEQFCIAIFPQYTRSSTSISIIKPIYIALDTRIHFEVWFVLLRAFTIPEVYGSMLAPSNAELSRDEERTAELIVGEDAFRMVKSLSVRVVEAKLRRPGRTEAPSKHTIKEDQDLAVGDYFVEVNLDGTLRCKTMIKHGSKNPFWREDCEFRDLPTLLPDLSIVVKRRIPLSDSHHGNSSINTATLPDQFVDVVCGLVNFRAEALQISKDEEHWWPVLDEYDEPVGEIFLKLRYEEMAVLLAQDYQPISELLHKFTNGLTLAIAQVAPSRLKQLSEIFMNIFQVSGQASNWLMALVEDEIDAIGKEQVTNVRYRFSNRAGSNDSPEASADREASVRDMSKSLTDEANLLFRGNSLLTQALDFHMRRVGKEYLEDILHDTIVKINEEDPDCEIDPARVPPGQDVSKHWTRLIEWTTTVWEKIAESAHKCPQSLRQILKFIRAVADDRYGDFLRTVPYTSVTGFLFLRFFCPAILNPKLFGLLQDHPKAKAQRTLTLIAKSLQVLANLSTFGQKEAWMEPMNRFLSYHRQQVKDFIDSITSIPADKSSIAFPAAYSTPITILGRLPPVSREGFPSLPYLIDHASGFAALVKIWHEVSSGQLVTSSLSGDLLKFHNLCIALHRRTEDCLSKGQSEMVANLEKLRSNSQWDESCLSLHRYPMKPTPVGSPLEQTNSGSSGGSTAFATISHSQFVPFTNSSLNSMSSLTSIGKPPGSSSSLDLSIDRASRHPSRTASEHERDGKKKGDEREKKERQSFWEATFGKDTSRQQRWQVMTDPGPGASYKATHSGRSKSPLNRGGSRGGDKKERKDKDKDGGRKSSDLKPEKATLTKERKKDKEDATPSKDKEKLLFGLVTRKRTDKEKDKDNEKAKQKISGPIEVLSKEARAERKERESSLKPGSAWNSGGANDGSGTGAYMI